MQTIAHSSISIVPGSISPFRVRVSCFLIDAGLFGGLGC